MGARRPNRLPCDLGFDNLKAALMLQSASCRSSSLQGEVPELRIANPSKGSASDAVDGPSVSGTHQGVVVQAIISALSGSFSSWKLTCISDPL